MKKIYTYFKLFVLMICSIIGVGFVSGAEIYQFFVRFKQFSFLGVFVFFVLIFLTMNKTLKTNCESKNIVKMNNFNKKVSNNTFLTKSKIKSQLLFFNIIMMASAMISGLFNFIRRLFFNNYVLFLIFALIVIFIILYYGVSGLLKFDYIVFVFIVFIVCCFCFKTNLSFCNTQIFSFDINYKYLIFSVLFSCLYVFMNIVQIQPIVNEFNIYFSNNSRKMFSLFFASILTFFLIVFVCFFNKNLYLVNAEMPFLKYFQLKGGVLYLLFVLGLFLALFSSLITSLIGVKNILNKKYNSNLISTFVALVLTCFFSLIGFSNFVSIVYPIIGIINFIIYVFL